MASTSLRRAMAMLVATALALTSLPAATATPPKPQPLSALELTAVLNRDVSIPGTAWMTRPDGRVVVSYDTTVVGATYGALTKITKQFGDHVILEKLPGKLTERLGGGGAIYGGDYRCSLGFNVTRNGNYYFLTAGHCGKDATTWYVDEGETNRIGTLHHASFPGNDYALVVYRSGLGPSGSVLLYNGRSQDITKAANPGLGQTVYRSGSTSGLHGGKVTGLRATVNYPEGRVDGLIRTNICAEPGDSGGPLFYRTIAFGLTSGGTGDCRSGGVTYFQPVVEALNRYGVNVY
jgi:hypothetical protein